MSDATGVEVWQRFDAAVRRAPGDTVFVADARVLRLHGHVKRALAKRPVAALTAGEAVKALKTVEALEERFSTLPRGGTVVALGGGTIGDVVTCFAHLHKRGARLVHVPTTLLAAVDSSVGGKGAVNAGGVKNALGVFHPPAETWICTEVFSTLTEAQRREGRVEAWKMAVTLDAATYARWRKRPPNDEAMLRTARQLKAGVCTVDPLETKGVRVVLNFGHTLGHVVESLSGFKVRHGDAVGLGLLCALDVGRALDVTPVAVAEEVEAALPLMPSARAALAKVMKRAKWKQVEALLRADKKGKGGDAVPMVLLEAPGRWTVHAVPLPTLRELHANWAHPGRPGAGSQAGRHRVAAVASPTRPSKRPARTPARGKHAR